MGAGLVVWERPQEDASLENWSKNTGTGQGDGRADTHSFAAGHSGNAVQDMVSVTLSKEKNNYGRFCQSGVMLVNASGGSQKNQNQEKFVADIVANEKRKVLCLYDLTIYLQI